MPHFKQKSVFNFKFHLTPRQDLFLLAVMGKPLVSEDAMMEMIWPDPETMPDLWACILMSVQCRLNKKIVGSGFRIRKSRGGFRLEKLKC